MKDTLEIGDHILVNKFIYGVKFPHLKVPFVGEPSPFYGKTLISIKEPKRGDVIVFKFPQDPGKDFIKRAIGVSGDVINIIDKTIYINNQPFKDTYGVFKDSDSQPRNNFGPVTVPAGSVFVMGDNRDQSYDSRFWGFVDLRAVKGKAFIIYWSWDRGFFNVRWNRIGRLIK